MDPSGIPQDERFWGGWGSCYLWVGMGSEIMNVNAIIMRMFLPINIRIDDKKILFVGGGKVAMHKIVTVEQYSSALTILAPEIHEELRGKGFMEICKEYEEKDLEGFFLIYACTNNLETNRRIKNSSSGPARASLLQQGQTSVSASTAELSISHIQYMQPETAAKSSVV